MVWDRNKERKAGKALGIGSSIYAIAFMVVWCGIAAAMGAGFMLVLGLPMLGFLIFRLVVLLRKGKETPKDPWEQSEKARSAGEPWDAAKSQNTHDFCPYCGEETKDGYTFCPKCGRRL